MKVILFSSKKDTPALFKALSKEFKDKLVFGIIKNAKALNEKFNIMELPSILLLD